MEPRVRIKGYSGEWRETTWGALTNDFKYGINAAAVPFDGRNKYLRITDIDDTSHVFLQDELTSPGADLSDCDEYIMHDGDIVVARTGASVGKSYIYRPNDGTVYFAGFLIRISFDDNIDHDFVFQNTLTEQYVKYIRIVSQRSGQPGVNVDDLKEYLLYVPSEKKEQEAIGAFLKSLDFHISTFSKRLKSLKQIKSASLQAMFPDNSETVPKVRFVGFKEDWRKTTLGRIVSITKGKQINKSNLTSFGEYYVLNGGIGISGYTNMYNTEKNTISISEGGNSCGYVNFNYERFWSGGHNYTLQDVQISNEYLYSYLKMSEKEIMKKRVGSGLPNIQKSALLEFPVYYPIDPEEQEKIGAFFLALDKQIDLQEKQIEKLQHIKAACLDQMFV